MSTAKTHIGRYAETISPPSFMSEQQKQQYIRAARAESVSGEICKVLGGLVAIIGAPTVLLFNPSPIGISTALAALSGGASMAALGSTATSSKKTARFADIIAQSK